jgi:hypothetical protein
MSGNIKVSYNISNIKSIITWDIKKIIFKWKGIIFGGFVRDFIISEHYAQLFYEKKFKYNSTNFWNEQFDPETAARTLIPTDIDVCLYNEQDVGNMVNEITALFNREFGQANVKYVRQTHLSKSSDFKGYIDNPIGNLYTIVYTITVGEIPYVSVGTVFNIAFDIVTTAKRHLKPPFNKLDFLCNGFIMTDHKEISLSNFTGTEIDNLKFVDKKEVESKIIKDIINFKTDYCLKFIKIADTNMYASIKYNEQACKRIEKMCNKKYAWTIENMPIIIDQLKKNIGTSKNCCICQDYIKKKHRFVSLPTFDSNNKIIKGMPIHADCFFKYMTSQIQDKRMDYENNLYIAENDVGYEDCRTFLRCPMRNKINFNVDNITSVINKYLIPGSIPA